ncbi:MAG: DUF1987 domain-containing protein [Chryseolinea sp.]
METLRIEGTDDTPVVILNKGNAIFEISGRSLPEDVLQFYEPVMDWIKTYSKESNPTTAFTFKLDYFNTASSKILLDLISSLKGIKGASIIWYYNEDDEEILDAGKEFSEQVDIPFEFRVY